MGLEFTTTIRNGIYETRGKVPDAVLPADFEGYNSGVYSRYTRLSRIKNLKRECDDPVVLSLEIKKVELSVLHGILNNYKVANAVNQEIQSYRNRLEQNPDSPTYYEDKSYLSMLMNMAVQAALIHYLSFTLEYGTGVVLPSIKEKRKYKCDLLLSENPGEDRPVICRPWPGDNIAFYVEPGQEPPIFLKSTRFAIPYLRFPLKSKENFDECRSVTKKEPVLVLVPYKQVASFMHRNWDVAWPH